MVLGVRLEAAIRAQRNVATGSVSGVACDVVFALSGYGIAAVFVQERDGMLKTQKMDYDYARDVYISGRWAGRMAIANLTLRTATEQHKLQSLGR